MLDKIDKILDRAIIAAMIILPLLLAYAVNSNPNHYQQWFGI